MKTKLETKFEKQSKPFIKDLKTAQLNYEKFLKKFIKEQITGKSDFNNYLENQVELNRCCCEQWSQNDLLDSFAKSYDFLEMIVDFQIFSLTYDSHLPLEDGGPLPFALAKERE